MKILPDLGQPQHWLAHAPSQNVERDQFAYSQAAGDDQLSSEIQNASHNDLVDELRAVAGGMAKPQDPEARRHVAGELLFPASLHLRLDRHRLEGLDPSDALHQKGLVLRAAPELLVEQPTKMWRRPDRNPHIERESSKDDTGQQWRIEKHDSEEDKGEEQVDHKSQRRTGQESPDVFQFAHARDRITNATGLEIGRRQCQQVLEQPCAEFHIDPVGGVRKKVSSQDAENCFEHCYTEQSDYEQIERADAAVDENLVHGHVT